MQRLSLSQSLSQKLSPQQIQFIKLLQVPTAELEGRIEEELEENPALEEGVEEPTEVAEEEFAEESAEKTETKEDEINVDDYLRDDDISGYKMQGDGENVEERDMPLATSSSLTEQLFTQLSYIKLDERQT
ncbi:MAG: RNA polymerase sigma-54 factor, partial [Bacteroidetes bacterium]